MGVTLDFYVLWYFLALKSRQLLEARQFSHCLKITALLVFNLFLILIST